MTFIKPEEMQKHWTAEARKKLQGRTIVDALYNQDPEFGIPILTIVLDNDTVLFPMQDDEGNGPGALHGDIGEESFILPTLR